MIHINGKIMSIRQYTHIPTVNIIVLCQNKAGFCVHNNHKMWVAMTQLIEHSTGDRRVAGSSLTTGGVTVLCR